MYKTKVNQKNVDRDQQREFKSKIILHLLNMEQLEVKSATDAKTRWRSDTMSLPRGIFYPFISEI